MLKFNKTIDGGDTFGHDADGSGWDLRPWSRDDAVSWQDISTPFDILIELEASEYSYSICVRNFENIRFELNSRFVPSLLHCAVVMATVQSTLLPDRTLSNFFLGVIQPHDSAISAIVIVITMVKSLWMCHFKLYVRMFQVTTWACMYWTHCPLGPSSGRCQAQRGWCRTTPSGTTLKYSSPVPMATTPSTTTSASSTTSATPTATTCDRTRRNSLTR